ncbi:MAG: hypothetical protein Tsb0026_17810 [Sulfuricaulis sp.]
MSCAQFEKSRQETDYTTRYRFLETESETAARNFKALPKSDSAIVRQYKMRVDPPAIRSCNHLTIHKDIYLQRKLDKNLLLEEVREFYTADGALIATKTESIADQLRTSGFYSGNALLPIPQKAPPGKYRLVSKLILKKKNNSRATQLAKTSVNFQVITRK